MIDVSSQSIEDRIKKIFRQHCINATIELIDEHSDPIYQHSIFFPVLDLIDLDVRFEDVWVYINAENQIEVSIIIPPPLSGFNAILTIRNGEIKINAAFRDFAISEGWL